MQCCPKTNWQLRPDAPVDPIFGSEDGREKCTIGTGNPDRSRFLITLRASILSACSPGPYRCVPVYKGYGCNGDG